MISAPDRHSCFQLCAPLLAIALALLAGCSPPVEITRFSGTTMGTTFQVTHSPAAGPVGEETRAVERLLEEINQSLSTYIDTSLVSILNNSTDIEAWHSVDRHFETVFGRSYTIYEDTKGAFNPAVAPLVNVWGFGPDPQERFPSPEEVEDILEWVRLESFRVRRSPLAVQKQAAEAKLDFSAIAKGYAVDALGTLLEERGVNSYFVEIGGEVRTRGEHPDRRPWRVGIEQPTENGSERGVQAVLLLNDAALATSGNYRQYRIQNGRKVAHILDPRTGNPESTSLLSVSVLAEDAMTADGYATAFMVMGLDEALRFVESHPNLEAYFIASGEGGETLEVRSSGFPEAREQ